MKKYSINWIALFIASLLTGCGPLHDYTTTIHGNVAGLAPGASVKLQSKNPDGSISWQSNISNNGDFSFNVNGNVDSNGNDGGASYSVTVQTQPTLPAHSCVVFDGDGEVYDGKTNEIIVKVVCDTAVDTLIVPHDGYDSPYFPAPTDLAFGQFTNHVLTFVACEGDSVFDCDIDYAASIAADAANNIYIADRGSNLIRKVIYPDLTTSSVLAGSGSAGSADGFGTAASFNAPSGIETDSNGNIYVADTGNNVIRKITPAGDVSTLAGSGVAGSNDGTGTAASFNAPSGIAIDSSGNIYVADTGNNMIRMITSTGVVSTIAGLGLTGSANGTGTAASFNAPSGIAIDSKGNIYVADTGNNMIRMIAPNYTVSTLAGTTQAGYANGLASTAQFNSPRGVEVDPQDNVYIADTGNNVIRIIIP